MSCRSQGKKLLAMYNERTNASHTIVVWTVVVGVFGGVVGSALSKFPCVGQIFNVLEKSSPRFSCWCFVVLVLLVIDRSVGTRR